LKYEREPGKGMPGYGDKDVKKNEEAREKGRDGGERRRAPRALAVYKGPRYCGYRIIMLNITC